MPLIHKLERGVCGMWVQVALWMLAMYGATVMLWQATRSFWFGQRSKRRTRTVCFIVIAKNAQRDIEAILYDIYGRCLHMSNPTLAYVIDVQSTDLTLSIVERFSSQFMPVESRCVATMEEASELAAHLQVAEDAIRCIIRAHNETATHTLVR